MSDVFQRTGRGGAGNYYSQKDIEEAEKAQRANDLEAQKTNTSLPPPQPISTTDQQQPTEPPTPQYVRVGRGGAGNWTEPPTVADAQDRQNHADFTSAAVSATGAGKPRTGLTGRGGAGNWTGDYNTNNSGDAATGGGEEEEEAERRRIADRIRLSIDASLPAPPKTYHQHDRDMEK